MEYDECHTKIRNETKSKRWIGTVMEFYLVSSRGRRVELFYRNVLHNIETLINISDRN